ncbi:carboxypeptidase M32 [bacterium]|nr:carboxypeptidase M32 [bacterium]MBU1636857.1 carboxypeptidase M32 [bacterium]
MMDTRTAYEALIKEYKAVSTLGSIEGLLHWDLQTMMPRKGAVIRADQMAIISGLAHQKLTSDKVRDLLGTLNTAENTLSDEERANLREIDRDFTRATKLPQELVEELTRQRSKCHNVWEAAREAGDFSKFAPDLEKLVDLTKQQAECLGYEDTPLDALIDEYEPGATAASLTTMFNEAKKTTIPLLNKILGSAVKANFDFQKQTFPQPKQKAFGEEITTVIGFDKLGSRLDSAVHPFCSGGRGDIRITARYNEHAPQQAIFGIIHETGHGLYEQGVREDTLGTPLSQPLSYGLHESQSRMWENIIGRSLPFWKLSYPILTKYFGAELKGVSVEDWVLAINHVEQSFVRVEADELTYDLHIILRFEIERELFAGTISVADLPTVWNKKFEDYLGLTPPNNGKEGVMQDIHWAMGSFGYFPSYSVGNIAAAQFWAKMKEDMPKLEQQIETGDFKDILNWLIVNVHEQGRRYSRDDLMKRATGTPLDVKHYANYLTEKFTKLYRV